MNATTLPLPRTCLLLLVAMVATFTMVVFGGIRPDTDKLQQVEFKTTTTTLSMSDNITANSTTTATPTLLKPIPVLPVPTQKQHWCLKSDPKPSQALTSITFLFKNLPRKALILFMGDSTVHEPFEFLCTCIFHQHEPIKHGHNETLVYSVSNEQVQILYFPNYVAHKPYSLPGNRVKFKLPKFLDEYGKPGFTKYAIWANFGVLHTLHRYPVHTDAGDLGGWTYLDEFVVEEAKLLVELGGFPRLLVSSPHALCINHFEPERKAWAEDYEVDPQRTSLRQCMEMFQGETGGKEFCEFGAALPSNAERLSKRFALIVENVMNPLMKNMGVKFGWLDSFTLTKNKCVLTDDGIHYESIVPIEVEAVIRWMVSGFPKWGKGNN